MITDWVAHALAGNEVWNIGQLTRDTVRALDREVRAGRLEKTREAWQGLAVKTVWHLPGCAPPGPLGYARSHQKESTP